MIHANTAKSLKKRKVFSFLLQPKHLLTAKGMIELLRSIAPFMKSQGRELFLKNKSSESDIKVYLNGWVQVHLSEDELRSPDALVISWQKLSSAINSILSTSTKNFPPSRYSVFYKDGKLLFLTEEEYPNFQDWRAELGNVEQPGFVKYTKFENLIFVKNLGFYQEETFAASYDEFESQCVTLTHQDCDAVDREIVLSPSEMTDLAIAWFDFLGVKNMRLFEEAHLKTLTLQ